MVKNIFVYIVCNHVTTLIKLMYLFYVDSTSGEEKEGNTSCK